jgi:hypothetical protein
MRARGGTRTGLQPLQTLGSPENMRNSTQSATSTTRSKAESVHIVHTLFLSTSATPTGLLDGRTGRAGFRSNTMRRGPETDRRRLSIVVRCGPFVGNRRTSRGTRWGGQPTTTSGITSRRSSLQSLPAAGWSCVSSTRSLAPRAPRLRWRSRSSGSRACERRFTSDSPTRTALWLDAARHGLRHPELVQAAQTQVSSPPTPSTLPTPVSTSTCSNRSSTSSPPTTTARAPAHRSSCPST